MAVPHKISTITRASTLNTDELRVHFSGVNKGCEANGPESRPDMLDGL
jgi:hypothetical protein